MIPAGLLSHHFFTCHPEPRYSERRCRRILMFLPSVVSRESFPACVNTHSASCTPLFPTAIVHNSATWESLHNDRGLERMKVSKILGVLCLLVTCVCSWAATPPNIIISVDATTAPRKIFHARLHIPATPGDLTLYYPSGFPANMHPMAPSSTSRACSSKPTARR